MFENMRERAPFHWFVCRNSEFQQSGVNTKGHNVRTVIVPLRFLTASAFIRRKIRMVKQSIVMFSCLLAMAAAGTADLYAAVERKLTDTRDIPASRISRIR